MSIGLNLSFAINYFEHLLDILGYLQTIFAVRIALWLIKITIVYGIFTANPRLSQVFDGYYMYWSSLTQTVFDICVQVHYLNLNSFGNMKCVRLIVCHELKMS